MCIRNLSLCSGFYSLRLNVQQAQNIPLGNIPNKLHFILKLHFSLKVNLKNQNSSNTYCVYLYIMFTSGPMHPFHRDFSLQAKCPPTLDLDKSVNEQNRSWNSPHSSVVHQATKVLGLLPLGSVEMTTVWIKDASGNASQPFG